MVISISKIPWVAIFCSVCITVASVDSDSNNFLMNDMITNYKLAKDYLVSFLHELIGVDHHSLLPPEVYVGNRMLKYPKSAQFNSEWVFVTWLYYLTTVLEHPSISQLSLLPFILFSLYRVNSYFIWPLGFIHHLHKSNDLIWFLSTGSSLYLCLLSLFNNEFDFDQVFTILYFNFLYSIGQKNKYSAFLCTFIATGSIKATIYAGMILYVLQVTVNNLNSLISTGTVDQILIAGTIYTVEYHAFFNFIQNANEGNNITMLHQLIANPANRNIFIENPNNFIYMERDDLLDAEQAANANQNNNQQQENNNNNAAGNQRRRRRRHQRHENRVQTDNPNVLIAENTRNNEEEDRNINHENGLNHNENIINPEEIADNANEEEDTNVNIDDFDFAAEEEDVNGIPNDLIYAEEEDFNYAEEEEINIPTDLLMELAQYIDNHAIQNDIMDGIEVRNLYANNNEEEEEHYEEDLADPLPEDDVDNQNNENNQNDVNAANNQNNANAANNQTEEERQLAMQRLYEFTASSVAACIALSIISGLMLGILNKSMKHITWMLIQVTFAPFFEAHKFLIASFSLTSHIALDFIFAGIVYLVSNFSICFTAVFPMFFTPLVKHTYRVYKGRCVLDYKL